MRKLLQIDLHELRCMTAGNWIYTGLQIENVAVYLTVVEEDSMALKTLTAKNPSEARGIRKALRAAGLKFEFKTAGKRRRKRNPAKKKKAAKRVRRTRSKSRRRR